MSLDPTSTSIPEANLPPIFPLSEAPTPLQVSVLKQLDEERIAREMKMRKRREFRPGRFAPAGEPLAAAMREFLKAMSPPRNPTPELLAERQAVFRKQCSIYRAGSGVEEIFQEATLMQVPAWAPDGYRELAVRMLGILNRSVQMVIVGDRGRGKTHMACGLINAFCDLGRRAIYRRTRDLFAELSKAEWAEKQRIRQSYLLPRLLVLDEVQQRDADRQWQDNELTDLIDRRYARNLATVMLANLAPDALWKNLGESIQRRVIETGDVWIANWPRIKAIEPGDLHA